MSDVRHDMPLPETSPTELIGDVKKLHELKDEIDKEFLNFSHEMHRRGLLLIRLHETILLENMKKQRVLEKVKQLLEYIDTAATLDVCYIFFLHFSLF